MLVFNFASRIFAYGRLAQGLSRALSASSSFMREYVDNFCVPAIDANNLITILRAKVERVREAGLKLSMHKCHFGATEIDFLGRTITSEGVKPLKERITNSLE